MKYECMRCGDCCRAFELELIPSTKTQRIGADIVNEVSRAYGIRFRDVRKVAIKVYGMCLAYDEEKKECKIYKDRSKACRDFYCGRHEKRRKNDD